ncbi:hypothetical protein BC832DRAFT_546890 [Gaertneriomyces semiglobifer]|nr:hypothetical protein BC832DRAFT_546890 [Gaertneriomyces semiglobifer]
MLCPRIVKCIDHKNCWLLPLFYLSSSVRFGTLGAPHGGCVNMQPQLLLLHRQ